MNEEKQLSPESREVLGICCQALDDTKGEDIAILDVSKQSSITNFLILATANSNPHLKALKRDLDKALKDHKVHILGVDEGDGSGWSVVDAFDVMIHLFKPEMRENYALETLWKDADTIKVDALVSNVDQSA